MMKTTKISNVLTMVLLSRLLIFFFDKKSYIKVPAVMDVMLCAICAVLLVNFIILTFKSK
jgi:hypothetical protein